MPHFTLTIDLALLKPRTGRQQRESIAEALRRVAGAVQHGGVTSGPVYGDDGRPVGTFEVTSTSTHAGG
jgi:hypothetical protein